MCDCDLPQAFNQVDRKARAVHHCCECGDAINPGDIYQYTSGVWDGRGASFKTCMRCVGVRNWYIAECLPVYECGPCFGDLYQDVTDYGNEGGIVDATQAAVAAGYL